MATQKSSTGRGLKFVLAGGLVVAVLLAARLAGWLPPEANGTEGAIGAAKRYQA
jgi:hypothetical protein